MLKTINLIFVWSGAKFYMNWILPTNPMSKNPVIKLLWGWTWLAYTAKSPKGRLALAYTCGIVHVFGFIISIAVDIYRDNLISYSSAYNILANVYPILVQLYIGYRCYIVLQHRNSLIIN